MAVTKTITANGSKGHHKFSLRVSEDTTSGNSSFMSYLFTIAPIQNGWDWYGFNIPYSVKIGGNTYTGNISSYNGSSTVTLSSGSNIEIPHNTDGTKSISISFSVTDSTGQNYTCGNASSSDTMTLTALHKPPKINTATMVETNQAMINLGISDTTIVSWLSQKRITLSATAYDGATLSYRLRHAKSDYYLPSSTTYQSSNVFNTDYRTNQVVIDNGKAPIIQTVVDNKGGSTSDLLMVNISGTVQQPNGIPYFKPTLERTSTTIKRKSGGGVNLTDNKATINVKGLIYKGSDVIGNYNSVKQLGYKIWERDATEPSSYTPLTPIVDINGNVTINSLEVNNINFIKVYKYKIILKDNYDYTYEIEDTIPTGQPIFTEYKDRVDFIEATIQNKKYLSNIGDCIKVVKNATQNITQNLTTQVTFEEVEYNTSSKLRLSNNAIYVDKNVNTILVNAQWNAWGSNGNSRYIYIKKNGTEVTFVSRAYTATLQSQVILPVEEGDYIELFCYTEQSGTTTITNGFMQTFMQVTILG